MSFLSKIGSILKNTSKVITAFGPTIPVVAGLLPTAQGGKVMDVFTGTSIIVGQVEAMHEAMGVAKSGPQKLQAAMPFVAGLVSMSDWMFDKRITDQDKFAQGIQQLTDAVVKITQSVEGLSPSEMNARIQEVRKVGSQLQGQYDPRASGLAVQ